MATSLILVGWQFLFLPTIVQYGFSVHLPQTFIMIYPTLFYVEICMLFWMWVSSEAHQSKAFFCWQWPRYSLPLESLISTARAAV
jgi:hypothetical protein